jgi:hypothetical protein
MMNNPVLTGPGYSVLLPSGFSVLSGDPYSGAYWLLPPGSYVTDIPAIVQIRPVQPMELPLLLQNLYQFENPYVAMINAANLGLANVTAIWPVRQVQLGEGAAHIREFDAITIRGFPARVMVVVIQGAISAVEVVTFVNLYRWAEFIGSCLNFVGGINLSGKMPSASLVQAVIDKKNKGQVEYHLINSDGTTSPLTSMPTTVENITIVHIDNSIKTGNIRGTGVVVGNHSIAKVKSDKP